MTSHPKRYMRDGTATTTRVRGVVRVECDNPAHVECWEALTSWAGDTTPQRDHRWHVYVSKSGAVCLLGPYVGRETPQFQTGLKRRVARFVNYPVRHRDGSPDFRYSVRQEWCGAESRQWVVRFCDTDWLSKQDNYADAVTLARQEAESRRP